MAAIKPICLIAVGYAPLGGNGRKCNLIYWAFSISATHVRKPVTATTVVVNGQMQLENEANPEEAVVFLLWLDCLDRIAIVELETRHFQVNIIQTLDEPILYRPLRFEEQYLWGEYVNSDGYSGNWLEIFQSPGIRSRDVAALASKWIVRYPLHDRWDATPNANDDIQWHLLERYVANKQRERIDNEIRKRLGHIWTHGLWSQDARRHYHALCASQILKSHLLRDTLVLCKWASAAFGHLAPHRSSDAARHQRAHLLLVRSAVFRRLVDQVQRLGDLQAQFERTLDLQLQEHPRPFLGRRREQGIYTSFLADRCFDIYNDVDELLAQRFRVISRVTPERAREGLSSTLTPLIMHRWHHFYTSSCKRVSDDVGQDYNVTPRHTHINFVNTSYWMPDRPDLQVVIAHETSHNVIAEKYGQLDAECLPLYNDKFAKLLRLLSHCMEKAGLSRNNVAAPIRSYPDLTLREIACDLLAASIYDHAYLLALCEEIIGTGLERLFLDPYNNYDLRMADYIDTVIFAHDDREWYYRLRVLCEWIRQIVPQEGRSPLADVLIEGVEKTVDGILEYLSYITPTKDETSKYYWKTLTDRMCELVRNSEAKDVVKQWKRDTQEADKNAALQYPEDTGERERASIHGSKHSRRLPTAVRRYIYHALIRNKTGRYRALFEAAKTQTGTTALCASFESFYFGPRNTMNYASDEPPIYAHLHDIPWESHILRALDFVKKNGDYECIKPQEWIKVANAETPLGRGLYHVALEFDCWLRRSPIDRMSTAIRLLRKEEIRRELESAVRSEIDTWLGKENNNDNATKKVYSNYLSGKMYRTMWGQQKVLEDRDITATVLHLAHPENLHGVAPPNMTREQVVVLEVLQERKLDELLDILTRNSSCNEVLGPLVAYLKLRQKIRGDEAPIKRLLAALSTVEYTTVSSEWKNALPTLQPYSIARIGVAGAQDDREGKFLKRVFEQGVWKEEPGGRVFHPVLGGYDIISVSPSLPMRRWPLPTFVGGGQSSPSEELFLPFFERRERAIPVRHNAEQREDWPDNWHNGVCPGKTEPPILAFLSICLSQRGLRLDFLWRLLLAIERNKVSDCAHAIPQLEQMAYCFNTDRIFLGQGWGDVVIAFGATEGDTPERLKQIFDIQNTLYEDFMVDRTELILSPTCLRIASDSEKYDIIIQCLAKESRDIAHCNKELTDAILANKEITVSRTPGASDFTLLFNGVSRSRFNDTRPLIKVFELFGNQIGKIEELVTTIGYRYETST